MQEIAETKMPDLNAANLESAMRMIEGTARSMDSLLLTNQATPKTNITRKTFIISRSDVGDENRLNHLQGE